jgi:hypothetical protein
MNPSFLQAEAEMVRPEGLEPPTLGSEVIKVSIETENDAE